MFKYNRFNKEELFEHFKSVFIKKGAIIIPYEYDIEINLIDTPKLEQADLYTYSDIIKEALANIPNFDNIIQKSCEMDYKKSDLNIRNFLFSLSYVNVSKDEISLCYWGDEVNSEFTVTFIKDGADWVCMNNKKI